MATTLGSKAVASIVKLKVNGTLRDFIVVNQGKPGTMYDDSCNGTWLLMNDIYENRKWHSSNVNNLENSEIHSYLNDTFINLFDANIRNQIRTVKIPYRMGGGTAGSDQTGANGLSCKLFLLSFLEVGYTDTQTKDHPVDGAILSYFKGYADPRRIAKKNNSAEDWWLRSPVTNRNNLILYVDSSGGYYDDNCIAIKGIRPALILPFTLSVSDDGTVITNTAPTITSSSGNSGVNLGSKKEAFNFQYTAGDADNDTLTVTEKLDGVTKKTRTSVTSGTTFTFECLSPAEEFQKITNGSHTITVEASDGKDTTTFTASFTKEVYEATITLKEPMAVNGDITAAVLDVVGDIPGDAEYKVEATNNAKDSAPVWQDVTEEVKSGTNIVFKNYTAANGAAFNFRITVKRGVSNTGGYISAVTGAFQ